MWKQIWEYGRQLVALASSSKQHENDIKAMRQELKELRGDLNALAFALQQTQAEQRHDRDMAARDREVLLLRLENFLLRSERGLPPPALSDEPPPPPGL